MGKNAKKMRNIFAISIFFCKFAADFEKSAPNRTI